MKEVLIFNDKNGAKQFENDVIKTMSKCNSLIEIFEAFQPWQKITDITEWIDLVSSPGDQFDKALLSNVNMPTVGKVVINPGAIADIFSIDRDSYLNAVAGLPLKTDCEPCRKANIKKGSIAITFEDYETHSDYLTFENGRFYLNQDAINLHKETFKVIATSDTQIEYYDHFVKLAEILNKTIVVQKFGPEKINQLAKLTGFLLLNNKLVLDDMRLADILKYMK